MAKTKITEFRDDLLHVFYEFLTYQQIPDRKWNFSQINDNKINNGFDCGYAGCAVGELPVVFDEFKMSVDKYCVIPWNFSEDEGDVFTGDTYPLIADFFGIERQEVQLLFDYNEYTKYLHHDEDGTFKKKYPPEVFREYRVGYTSRKDIARGLKRFIEWRLTQ
jgi:hypothetical protein